jgi:ADP-heptose:LPS heptosyltransferase
MTVPVISEMLNSHPSLKISILTKKHFTPLYSHLDKVNVIGVDFQNEYRGLLGLLKLSKKIKTLNVDFIADLHNVLRTKILKLFLFGYPFQVINKARSEKKKLVQGKSFQPLKSTTERYADVIRAFGLKLNLEHPKFPSPLVLSSSLKEMIKINNKLLIGVAPFAAHKSKTYPLDKMKKIINNLSKDYTVVLFGGGKNETIILDKIANQSSSIISFSGKFSMEEEIQLMSHLKLMISMDSGNAHMAAMMGVKVITLWGVTHPFAGFKPFNQPFSNCLLSDRTAFPLIPTSIYGNIYPKNYENAIASIPESEVLKAIKNNI